MNFLDGLFGKSKQTSKERLIQLIQKFEIQRTPLETKPSNSMGTSALRGYATVIPDSDAAEYESLKNEFAVDILTHQATYLPVVQEHREFFADVAQTTNGSEFMRQKGYRSFDNVQQTGGRRRTRNRRRKYKSKRV